MNHDLRVRLEKWVIWGVIIGVIFLLRHLFPLMFLTFVLTYIGSTVVAFLTRRFRWRRLNLSAVYILLLVLLGSLPSQAFITDSTTQRPPTTGGYAYYSTYGSFGPDQAGQRLLPITRQQQSLQVVARRGNFQARCRLSSMEVGPHAAVIRAQEVIMHALPGIPRRWSRSGADRVRFLLPQGSARELGQADNQSR